MGAWIKGGLAGIVAFGVCWAGAIACWQVTGHSPSNTELVALLLVLPLALLAVYLLVRRRLALAAASATAATPAAVEATPQAEPGPSLLLLAAALRTPYANSAEQLAQAILGGSARGDLDTELHDDEGYPVLSARVDAPIDAIRRQEITAWLAARGLADPELSDEQWRALGMATAVGNELAQLAATHPLAQPEENQAVSSRTKVAAEATLPVLQVLLALSGAWNEAQRGAAAAWLRHVTGTAGWPEERISVAISTQPESCTAVAHSLDQLTRQATAAPTLAMLLACDSHIGATSVENLAAEGRLFLARRQQGLIPGEGAAGLLLADTTQAALPDTEVAHLHAVAARRDASADGAGRPGQGADAALLRRLAAEACLQGAVAPGAVTLLVADSGHRTSRTMELMDLANRDLAQLDAGTDILATGAACGHAGAVPFVAALALAFRHAVEQQAPVLCTSNEDPHHRSAVLVRPPALQS
jgi:hypothetical protein